MAAFAAALVVVSAFVSVSITRFAVDYVDLVLVVAFNLVFYVVAAKGILKEEGAHRLASSSTCAAWNPALV